MGLELVGARARARRSGSLLPLDFGGSAPRVGARVAFITISFRGRCQSRRSCEGMRAREAAAGLAPLGTRQRKIACIFLCATGARRAQGCACVGGLDAGERKEEDRWPIGSLPTVGAAFRLGPFRSGWIGAS